MQYDLEFRFDMDDSFSMCSQPMSLPPTENSFSSTSSVYEPFTPTSRRSTPNGLTLDFDGACASFAAHHGDLGSASDHMPRYMYGAAVKSEAEHLSFGEAISPSPMKKMDGLATPDYERMTAMSLPSRQSIGSITPPGNFPMYSLPPTAMAPASFMMTPTHSLSGSDVTESSSSWCSNDSPIPFFHDKSIESIDMERLDLDTLSHSPLEAYSLQGPPSPDRLRGHRKMMVHEIQRKTTELQRAQIRESRRVSVGKTDGTGVDVVRRAMCKCDYPGCHKAFRRNEHLKRHKQT